MKHINRNYFLILILCCFCSNQVAAQSPVEDTASKLIVSAPESNQKDLVDVYHTFFKKNREDNLDTKHEPWKFHFANVPAVGYTLQTGWAGILASNIGFYTTSDTTAKVSNMQASIAYSEFNQTILPFQANIWTAKNKYNIIIDWRYMDYPSETFGLGGHTELNNGYTINFSYAKIHQSVLKEVTKNFLLGAGFFYDYMWNIKEVNPPSNVKTSFQRYDNNGPTVLDKSVSSGFALRTQYDDRLNQINSSNGWYAAAIYRPNYTWLGSDNNWETVQIDIRKYIPLSKNRHSVLAFWNLEWLTLSGKPPYLMLPSTGWDDNFNMGRGYIQGRFRAKQLVYFESEYRFDIVQNGLIGGVVFANVQSYSSQFSKELRYNEMGYGAGLRIKLNKLSGANLCIDYGIGTDGSKGFFVNLGEVF